jgi:hypothetical protein
MDCRKFRNNHAAFADDTLPGVAMEHMRAHLGRCVVCTRYDARLRRAIMFARNAPTLQPSADFQRRLSARLAAERLAAPFRPAKPRWAYRIGAAAAAIVLIGGAGFALIGARVAQSNAPLAMAPVVVRPASLPAEPMAAPAMFATVSSSLPVYPAVLLAQRATEQFAAIRERNATSQAAH